MQRDVDATWPLDLIQIYEVTWKPDLDDAAGNEDLTELVKVVVGFAERGWALDGWDLVRLDGDAEAAVVEIASAVSFTFMNQVGYPWPQCPVHDEWTLSAGRVRTAGPSGIANAGSIWAPGLES